MFGSTAKKSILIVGALVVALLAWMLTGKPVLFRTSVLDRHSIESCGSTNEAAVGLTLFNPLRARGPEISAEPFVREATNASCSPTMGSELCQFVRTHEVPSGNWKLVNRWDTPVQSTLLFRLKGDSKELVQHSRCAVMKVDLQKAGTRWHVVGYGLTYRPYAGGAVKDGGPGL